MQKMRQGDWLQTPFQFLRKIYISSKQRVRTLFLISFGRPPLGHTIQTSCITFQIIDPEI